MKVVFSLKASRQINKFPVSEGLKITKKLRELENSPFSGKLLSEKLKNHFSLRAWPYRIIYQILKDQKIILIDTIEHHQSVYK